MRIRRGIDPVTQLRWLETGIYHRLHQNIATWVVKDYFLFTFLYLIRETFLLLKLCVGSIERHPLHFWVPWCCAA